MTKRLEGQVAIVTGAASGLGKAFTEALAAEGATVVINDINEVGGLEVEKGITAAGGKGFYFKADVSKGDEVKGMIDETMERFKQIDILINNAGVQHIAPIVEFTEEMWNRMIGVMLTGPFLTTKYAFPHMKARRRGRIINISSTQGLVSSEFKAAYVSAKHGVVGLTKVTALEGAPHDVTAVAVCPSYVRTPLAMMQVPGQAEHHGISEDEVVQKIMLGPAPLKKLLEPEEVAALIVFLCTEPARAITGSPIAIDCGWTAK